MGKFSDLDIVRQSTNKSYAILLSDDYPPEPFEVIKIDNNRITMIDRIEDFTFTVFLSEVWILT